MTQGWRVFVLIAAVAAFIAPAAAQGPADRFGRFAEHDPDSEIVLDFSVWTEMLRAIVYDVGMSDRYIPKGRIIETGSRVTGQSTSRYRTEGNRVIFHLLEDFHLEALSAYRADLTALPDQVSLARLNKDQQLAYWLNLHNVIVIDEIAKRYPMRALNRVRMDDGEILHDSVVATIEGVPLTLTDIRNNIVGRYWDTPLAMYGFYYGAIGGPSLQARAFTGSSLRPVLSRNAREYVNALRGVENSEYTLRVSQIYFDNQRLFPNWPEDLFAHLDAFADEDVSALVETADRVRAIPFEWDIADMTNGAGECGGGIRRNVQQDISSGPGGGAASLASCTPLPPTARNLTIEVQQRRLRLIRDGALGRVVITDVATEDEDHSRSGGASGSLVGQSEREPEG
ncbi:MAG: DUF547 domain-containing protein [Oceanicaulis sp.]